MPESIIEYWFGDAAHDDVAPEVFSAQIRKWFAQSDETDRIVKERFGAMVDGAIEGRYDAWTATPVGRLALVILLDQFSRNLFRGTARAFAQDARALALVQEGLEVGVDRELSAAQRLVFYLPLMHTEDLATQEKSVGLFTKLAEEGPPPLRDELGKALGAARYHHKDIARFGRFPYRNAALGRPSTPEEVEYLASLDE